MHLDPKGLEAAELELSDVLKDWHYVMPTDGIDRVIRAYLSTVTPAEAATELIDGAVPPGEATCRVDAKALKEVLVALIGPPHLIRELQAIRSLGNSPIDKLVAEFNEQVQEPSHD